MCVIAALQAQRIQFPSPAGSVVAFSASGQPCRSVFLTSKAEVYTLGARVCDPSVIDEEPRKVDLSSLFVRLIFGYMYSFSYNGYSSFSDRHSCKVVNSGICSLVVMRFV